MWLTWAYRRIYLQQMNKMNKLSHFSCKSDKLYPPRDWGSLSTGREYCLLETLATLAGCCQRQSRPHSGCTLPSIHGASLPKAVTPHSKVKPELRPLTSLPGDQLCHPRPEFTVRWLPLQLRPLPCGLDLKAYPLSMLTGGLGMTHRGAEAGAVHGNHRSDRGMGGAAEVKTGST